MTSNCSFRITRTTEDLAETITQLSLRLVKLEQRFEAMELELNQKQPEIPENEIEMLDGIDQQLKECKELLESSSIKKDPADVLEVKDIPTEENQSKSIEVVEVETPDQDASQMWIEEEKADTQAA